MHLLKAEPIGFRFGCAMKGSMTDGDGLLYSESIFAEAQTADDSHVIRNVLLCGNRSRNGYSIPPSAFGSEANVKRLYDQKPVFLDHEKGKELSRKVKELAAVVTNVRFIEGKPYGDLDTESCPAGTELLALARKRLPNFGLSHIAAYTKSRSGKAVESVDEVVSVDVVFRPATTNTFFERANEELMELETLKSELATARQERDDAKAKVETLSAENVRLTAALGESESKQTTLSRENTELKTKLDAHEQRAVLEQRKLTVEAELRAEGLDPADEVVCSKLFLSSLQAESEQSIRSALIADRKAILGSAAGPQSRERRDSGPKGFDPSKYHESVKSTVFGN